MVAWGSVGKRRGRGVWVVVSGTQQMEHGWRKPPLLGSLFFFGGGWGGFIGCNLLR